MAYISLFKSVPLANGEKSGNGNGVCRYVGAELHLATLFQPSFSRFHEFTNSAKGNQSDKDRNDWWEKKPYSVNSATNELENTFSIISIVEFNAGFITYFWAHHRTKATNETFFKMTIFARYKYLLWCYESRIWVLCICDLWIFGHGILGWVSSTLFSFPFSPLVLVCSSFAKD